MLSPPLRNVESIREYYAKAFTVENQFGIGMISNWQQVWYWILNNGLDLDKDAGFKNEVYATSDNTEHHAFLDPFRFDRNQPFLS